MEVLDREPAVVYALDRAGTVVYVNPAWDRFARANGGPRAVLSEHVVGTRWLDHIGGEETRARFEEIFRRVLERDGTRGARGVSLWSECSSPGLYRKLVTRFEPVFAASGEAEGVLSLSTIIAEAPIAERHVVSLPDDARFQGTTGRITQCAWCRRVHLAGTEPRLWLFVPAYVESPPSLLDHGICELCRELYYR